MKRALVLFLLAACGEKAAPPPPAPAPSPAAPPTSALGARLEREAAARPAGGIRVEDLVEALERRGVAVARTRQVLGAPLGARYCAIAMTRAGLGLSVCEFDHPAAAASGRQRSHESFDALVPGRRLETSGSSLLTITAHDPALDGEAGIAAESFAALGATATTKGE